MDKIRVFISYARKDRDFLDRLLTHLAPLQTEGLIEPWTDLAIEPGDRWDDEIALELNCAEIVLLLISADFLASKYIGTNELATALERELRGEAVVIPVILKFADWATSPFHQLQALPPNAKPITEWRNRDEAYVEIAHGVRRVIGRLRPATPGGVTATDQSPRPAPAPETVQQNRVLDAAMAARIPLGKPSDLAVMVRLPDSAGLKALVGADDEFTSSPEDVKSKPFQLEFGRDARGRLKVEKLTVRIESPDFDPPSQSDDILVPPDRDSDVCTFLLRPLFAGELVIKLKVFAEDGRNAIRLMRIVSEASDRVVFGGRVVASIPMATVAFEQASIPAAASAAPAPSPAYAPPPASPDALVATPQSAPPTAPLKRSRVRPPAAALTVAVALGAVSMIYLAPGGLAPKASPPPTASGDANTSPAAPAGNADAPTSVAAPPPADGGIGPDHGKSSNGPAVDQDREPATPAESPNPGVRSPARENRGGGGRAQQPYAPAGGSVHHSGGNAVTTRRDPSIAVIRDPRQGIEIHRSMNGSRRIEVTRPGGVRVVFGSNRAGFVERSFAFGGSGFTARTFYVGGHITRRVYQTFVFRGVLIHVYQPSRFYPAAYYGWAYNPWVIPVPYRWDFIGAPWYAASAGYWAPKAAYAGAGEWLADFTMSKLLEQAYEGQVEAVASPPSMSGSNGVTPDIQAEIVAEVRRQIAIENAEAQGANDPASSGIPRSLADGSSHVFLVGNSLDLAHANPGEMCLVTAGDLLQLRPQPQATATEANLIVLASKGGKECAKSSEVAVPLDQLQEMQNGMREQIDDGLYELHEQQGNGQGIPAAPSSARGNVTEAIYAQAAPPVEHGVQTDLAEEQKKADTLEHTTKP